MEIILSNINFDKRYVRKEKDYIVILIDITFDFDQMDVDAEVKKGMPDYPLIIEAYPNGEFRYEVWHDSAYTKYNWIAKCCGKRRGGICPYFTSFGEEILKKVLEEDVKTKAFFERNRTAFLVGEWT